MPRYKDGLSQTYDRVDRSLNQPQIQYVRLSRKADDESARINTRYKTQNCTVTKVQAPVRVPT